MGGVVVSGVIATVAAFVLVCLGALVDSEEIGTSAELESVDLGLPLNWVVQDQSYYSPAQYPVRSSIASPLESPTSTVWSRFLANVVMLLLPLWGFAYAVARRSRRSETWS